MHLIALWLWNLSKMVSFVSRLICKENKYLISGKNELCAPGVNSPMVLEPFENNYYTHSSLDSLHSFVCLYYFHRNYRWFSLSCSILISVTGHLKYFYCSVG